MGGVSEFDEIVESTHYLRRCRVMMLVAVVVGTNDLARREGRKEGSG